MDHGPWTMDDGLHTQHKRTRSASARVRDENDRLDQMLGV